uniref:S1 motif domain-containing protein n=1 Tax=Periophthalmus magnuspinnatus TaxID=409849 RepID=A0A3B3ZW78_9GOBI
MASMEEDFPRGGIVKKPTESQIVVQRSEVDNLFQNVKEGMLFLGCVKEVTDFEVTVSLTGGIQGFLGIKNISDSYTKLLTEHINSDEFFSLPHLFIPGMVIRCVVAKIDLTKRGSFSIQLSVNPKMVNKSLSSSSLKTGMSGCVESVEDHGYVIDIGVSGSKAFLPKLHVGQYVTSLVEKVKNDGRIVQLSVSPKTLAQAFAGYDQGWTLTNILPGLLVNATIKKVTKHGLFLKFLSNFSGQVDFLHLEPEKASNYKEGDEVRACVLYVDPTTRLIGLSLRNYLVVPGTRVDTGHPGGIQIGQVVKNCKMTALHHASGGILELPDNMQAFVHQKYHMKEHNALANENKMLAKAEHTCRILDFCLIDQIYCASLRVIEKPFFRYHDIHPGQIVEGTVSVLFDYGMIVHLSDNIKGLVPRTHLSDIVLKNPEKKYMEGMKVKCRVLSVDPENKKLSLTRKKALIESSLPLFLSFADARPGRVSHGYIVCIKHFGCIVRFYNNVKGLVPLNELSSEAIVSPEEFFYVGQVCKTKVLQCDPEKEKLLLSFKAAVEGNLEEPLKSDYECDVGKKVDVRVLKKLDSGFEVAILPNEIPAVLPTLHLTDHLSNAPLLWQSLQKGDTISSLVCFYKNKQNITLTKKPTIKWAIEEGILAEDFSKITVGMQLYGWIKNIMAYGVFVEFPYGLVGLSPKSAMADKFIADATTAFELGQTVIAKVTNIDKEKLRFLVTLKMSEVISPVGNQQTSLTNGLQERWAVTEMLSMRLIEGSKYEAMVQFVEKDFAVISLGDTAQMTIIQTRSHLNEVILDSEKLKPGMTFHAEVIDPTCEALQGLPLVSWEQKPVHPEKLYKLGQAIQAKVVDVSSKPQRFVLSLTDLSLLPVDTGKPDVLPESLDLPLRLVGEEKKKHDMKRKHKLSETQKEVPTKKKKSKKAKMDDSDSGVEVFFREEPQKKTRHELEQEKKEAEKALVKRELELMDPNLRPEDDAAFERLLLASPNSSLLWLQYMAHHLQATQIEQARTVAERALKTISFEEQEKLNVWVALLNLENMYGTAESLKKVFERALQFCEPMPVYQQLADIYTKSDKTKEAEVLYKTMVKKFRQNKDVWLSYGTFLLQQGQSGAASALLQRALKSLPSKDVDVIAKFAQLEFRYGDMEKGHAMFDKVLTSYPKRTDLWSVFIDLTVKHGSQKEVALFDRVIHLSVSMKKIKFFFKRYLEYEKKHGTPQSIQKVKEKAMEFVESKGTEAAS